MLRNTWRLLFAITAVLFFWPANRLCALPSARALPPLHDGSTVAGPGGFQHDGTMLVRGAVTLRDLELDLRGPIVVEPGARLTLDHVQLRISDPPNAPNGTSGLQCKGAATLIVKNSSMEPVGAAHPMWMITGSLQVDGFQTANSEFHLKHATADIQNLKIFEFEASEGSQVRASHLDLVFFSTHTSDNEALTFADVPTEKAFSRAMKLGSGASGDFKDTRVQIFLVYVHGQSKVALANMGRVQLALNADCRGSITLPQGRLGTDTPAIFPAESQSDCPFRLTLRNVNVDSWDVYADGHADLSFADSVIDELTASSQAHIRVKHSRLYADWLALSDNATLVAADSKIGALSMAAQRPDLATSQVRLSGQSHATFLHDRFDCGIFASGHADATLIAPLSPPRYRKTVDAARITEHADSGGTGH